MTKDAYRAGCKAARQQLRDDFRAYRFAIKKQRLLRKRSLIQVELENMGVVFKQIPVVIMEGTPQKIKVYSQSVEVAKRAREIKVQKGRRHEQSAVRG